MSGVMQWWDGIVATFIKCFLKDDRYLLLLDGIGVTIKISLLAVLIGIAIGLVIAFCALSKKKVLPVAAKHSPILPKKGTPSECPFLNRFCHLLFTKNPQTCL